MALTEYNAVAKSSSTDSRRSCLQSTPAAKFPPSHSQVRIPLANGLIRRRWRLGSKHAPKYGTNRKRVTTSLSLYSSGTMKPGMRTSLFVQIGTHALAPVYSIMELKLSSSSGSKSCQDSIFASAISIDVDNTLLINKTLIRNRGTMH